MDKISYQGKNCLIQVADICLTPTRIALGGRCIRYESGKFSISSKAVENKALKILSGILAFALLPISFTAYVIKRLNSKDYALIKAAHLAIFESNGGKLRVGTEKTNVPETLSTTPMTPLQRHVNYFKDKRGKIYESRIRNKLITLGIGKARASKAARMIHKVLAFRIYKCPFKSLKLESIHRGIHPMDSGVYNKDGSINEAAWEQIKSWDKNGSRCLNLNEIDQMLDNNETRDKYRGGNKIWALGGRGEWHMMVELFGDSKEYVDGKWIDGISFKRLRQFLESSDTLFLAKEAERRGALSTP